MAWFGRKKAHKDPVCGMDVEDPGAGSYTHEGKTYWFCSEHCMARFKADPPRYL